MLSRADRLIGATRSGPSFCVVPLCFAAGTCGTAWSSTALSFPLLGPARGLPAWRSFPMMTIPHSAVRLIAESGLAAVDSLPYLVRSLPLLSARLAGAGLSVASTREGERSSLS